MFSAEQVAPAAPGRKTDDHQTWERGGQAGYWLARHWLWLATFMVAVYAGLPWLAPLFMEAGWVKAGQLIYLFYSTQCHQLPQRSFFLFGRQPMISLSEIQSLGNLGADPLELRRFIGNPTMGWKVAWSDRMVAMYSSMVVWVILLFGLSPRRLRPLSWRGLFLLLSLMIVDGTTHMISDLTGGIGAGFRDSNAWLAGLTNNAFAATFYGGDALGSFNSWMRLLSGVLFGLAVVWFLVPRIQRSLNND
jgi:uncharacterized membrane protein